MAWARFSLPTIGFDSHESLRLIQTGLKLDLKKGDLVTFVETEDGVLISRQEVVALKALREIGKSLKEKGISVEELMASGRDIRGDLLGEMFGIDSEKSADDN